MQNGIFQEGKILEERIKISSKSAE